MKINLNEHECRVVGVLLEKSMTTPDQYPLTLNVLISGCNQKSNRYPVMSLSESDVVSSINSLTDKRLIQTSSGFGSRVDKYTHRFCNTEFNDIKLSNAQTAVLTELMLRGPQTPGELRGRCQRMAPLKDASEVESALASMQAYQPHALVTRLNREPGKREARYQHCFFTVDENSSPEPVSSSQSKTVEKNLESRIEALEQEVETLKNALASLTQ